MVNCSFRDDFGHLKLSQNFGRPDAARSTFAHRRMADAHESLVRWHCDSRDAEGEPREREDFAFLS
jgi:hypothetical protein